MPTWQVVGTWAVALLWVVVIILWHGRIAADAWPIDAARVAPNVLASFVIFSGLVVLWPAARRAVKRAFLAPFVVLHDHHVAAKAHRDELLHHVQHLIAYHPEVPNTDYTGRSMVGAHPPGPEPTTRARRRRAPGE